MCDEKRSVHSRLTAELWTDIAHEAARRGRLSVAQTMIDLATERLTQIHKSESTAEPATQLTLSASEVKHG
ncbi:hypothetical protein [Streptomyces anandii]|uniref:hypothetical protein n=1 Tax=Streptomyces anandii TaxID=285454 RepID=UPI0016763F66|nr:hypothetical protein [Streptomyces anandii]